MTDSGAGTLNAMATGQQVPHPNSHQNRMFAPDYCTQREGSYRNSLDEQVLLAQDRFSAERNNFERTAATAAAEAAVSNMHARDSHEEEAERRGFRARNSSWFPTGQNSVGFFQSSEDNMRAAHTDRPDRVGWFDGSSGARSVQMKEDQHHAMLDCARKRNPRGFHAASSKGSAELVDGRGAQARVWNLDLRIGVANATQSGAMHRHGRLMEGCIGAEWKDASNLKPFEVGQIRRGRYDPSQRLVGLQSGLDL